MEQPELFQIIQGKYKKKAYNQVLLSDRMAALVSKLN